MTYRSEVWEVDPIDPARVVCYDEGRPHTRAECWSDTLPDYLQVQNARLVAKAPAMLRALLRARDYMIYGSALDRANAVRDIREALRGIE